MTPSRALSWGSVLLALSMVACKASSANDKALQAPHPSEQDVAKAINASYQPGPNSRQECLGRLTFNVGAPIKWALSASTTEAKDQMPSLSREIRSGDERLEYGDNGFLYVLIYPGATQGQLDKQYQDTVEEEIYFKRELAERVEFLEENLHDLKTMSPSERDPRISEESYKRGISDREAVLAEKKSLLANFGEGIHPLDFGMPDRKGYAQGRFLQGFLWRDGVYYRFVMGDNSNDTRSDAEREAWFSDVMKRFQTRKLYEVPKGPGVCVPYGFFPDDGTVPFHSSAGFRFDDRPNVLYALNTQWVGKDPVDNTLFTATARASVGLMAGFANEEVAKVIKRRVGPHRAYIGELAAEQGGAVVRLTEGKRKFDNYSVYTGYMGWMHSHELPFIAVDMRSFTQAETARSPIEKLKTDPPPFEESKARLDALLKSIRFRSTKQPEVPQR